MQFHTKEMCRGFYKPALISKQPLYLIILFPNTAPFVWGSPSSLQRAVLEIPKSVCISDFIYEFPAEGSAISPQTSDMDGVIQNIATCRCAIRALVF